MKTIKLPVHNICVSPDQHRRASITCSPDLYELCPHCSSQDCCFQCDESTTGYRPANPDRPGGRQVISLGDNEAAVSSRLQFNGAVDGIMSMILAHAVAGIDIESPTYLEGIETALEAASENI